MAQAIMQQLLGEYFEDMDEVHLDLLQGHLQLQPLPVSQ